MWILYSHGYWCLFEYFTIITTIKFVIKKQWKILKLRKRELNKKAFNLRITSMKTCRTSLYGFFGRLTASTVSIFQRVKLLQLIPLFFFCLILPKNHQKFQCVYKRKQRFWQFFIICNSHESFLRKFSFHVVNLKTVLLP